MSDTTQQMLTVNEVADLLHISPGAVVKRIERGKLMAAKTDTRQWQIPWPQDNTSAQQDETPRTRQRHDRQSEIEELRALVARQEEEIQFLRRQIEINNQLHAEALRRIPALLAPDIDADRTRHARLFRWPWQRKG